MPGATAEPSRRQTATVRAVSRGRADNWTVLLEFAPFGANGQFVVAEVEDLIDRLDDWRAVGLWHRDRYAVQLQIPAPSAHEALQQALHHHGQAAEAAAVTPSKLLRVEVSTVEELERAWQEDKASSAANVSPYRADLLCPELYSATRLLVAATTTADIADSVNGFVAAIGADVEPGAAHRPDTISIDVSLDNESPGHAVADTISVAAVIIEWSLPTLLADARFALARLKSRDILPDR